ncbi:putative bifunctional diguanylate cyclase/phosphodiesterase [Pseudonocardia xinjiangensis]|uniref:putative bifunctional diguanylate cyclase/phosphodiesterase n=1 Tax=Pseudonocardia xinjiangensis TaxID=75289 RepID=UPI003D8CC591
MVAPRSLPDAVDAEFDNDSCDEPPATERARIERLAARWAQLGPPDDPGVAPHLATLLRRLAAILRAEPFWPLAAREVGSELLSTGLCGAPGRPTYGFDDIVPPSLRLLRREAADVIGVPGGEGERRLVAVLDELLAGVIRSLQDRNGAGDGRSRPTDDADAAVMRRHMSAVYEQSSFGVVIMCLDGRMIDVNPALARMFGLDGPLDQPRPVSDFVHPDDVLDVVQRFQRLAGGGSDVVRMELRLARPDSEVLWVHVTASRIVDDSGEPSHLMAVVEDVSDRHRLRSWLQGESYQDQLTRLPNRAVTEAWLHRAFASDGPERVGICVLDIDGFHPINDGLGQQTGDRLLLAVAGRLQLAAGSHLVTRIGADEFAVLVSDSESSGDVGRLADRLQAALVIPFQIDGHTLVVSASIGVAESETAGGSAAELLRGADVARSWAKALGGGRRVVFDPERDATESARFALLSGLRGAIDRGEFRLAFQPLVQLTDGRVRGAEALVRWDHPEQGVIGPGRFIELAEHSGAIVPLGRWVLEEACGQAASWWRELGPAAPFVSVNVSPLQLTEPGWVHVVTGALSSTGLPPELLQLEITEQAVLGDETVALDALNALRAAGVRLALDDFGTGYSSLAWLRTLPVNALKIDGSFIDGLRNPSADPTDSSIVRALVEMAHALGLNVTAEWVETPVQAERLAELGCDMGQGRWFGDAGPGMCVPELLRRSIGS